MKDINSSEAREQLQLAACQQLVLEKTYLSQEEIRRDLQRYGFDAISQSTVSRLLKILGIIKIRNAKGQKIYSLNPLSQPTPNAARTVAEMVVSVEYNDEFVLIHTVAGYARAIARILDYHALPEILGVVACSNIVWVAPRDVKQTAMVYRNIKNVLKMNIHASSIVSHG